MGALAQCTPEFAYRRNANESRYASDIPAARTSTQSIIAPNIMPSFAAELSLLRLNVTIPRHAGIDERTFLLCLSNRSIDGAIG